MNILVINAGSSSLKYQLFNMDTESVIAKGQCERIGLDGKLVHKVPGREDVSFEIKMPTHNEAIRAVLDILVDKTNGVISSVDEIDAVGHRVLHGGAAFTKSCVIDDKCIEAIKGCIPLGPLHNPANLMGIFACQEAMPTKKQVAVFDTAFHMTMPPKAYMYAIPYDYYTKYQVRRYGFHGTSHRFVTSYAAKMLGKPIEELKLISCHMGNGSSVAAVSGGKCVDTSMGITPLAGLPMGTRCGDIDATITEFIMDRENIDIHEMLTILNKKSGVLGVSGVSSDFRDLEKATAEGNERAKLALDMFEYSVSKFVGAYAVAMGGFDAVIFTGGIGENTPAMRAGICEKLKIFGVEIDPEKNKSRGKAVDLSTDSAKVKALVVPTNEELVIARDTKMLTQN